MLKAVGDLVKALKENCLGLFKAINISERGLVMKKDLLEVNKGIKQAMKEVDNLIIEMEKLKGSPLCKCGCGEPVKWNKSKKRWNIFLSNHQARNKNYHENYRKQFETPPLCKCKCGEPVKWNNGYKDWNEYITLHCLNDKSWRLKNAEAKKNNKKINPCKFTIQYIIKEVKKAEPRYKVLSKEYIDANSTSLRLKCDKGHIYTTRWASFQQGRRCPKCGYKIIGNRLSIKIIKNKLKKAHPGYSLLSMKYHEIRENLIFKCDKGHLFNKSWWLVEKNKIPCPICYSESRGGSKNHNWKGGLHIPKGEAPLCKCGCQKTTDWNKYIGRWNDYILTHHISAMSIKMWSDPIYRESRSGKNHPNYGKKNPSVTGDKNPMRNPEIILKISGPNHSGWKGGVKDNKKVKSMSENLGITMKEVRNLIRAMYNADFQKTKELIQGEI